MSWLPNMLNNEDYEDFSHFFDVVKEVFKRDFDPRTLPRFQGRRLALKRHPMTDGLPSTFWHFVTEGAVESERTIELSRCRRIPWPRAILVNSTQVHCWQEVKSTKKGKAKRVLLALPDFSYLFILDDRDDYLLPWTAYPVEYNNQRRRLEKRWKKSTAPPRKDAGAAPNEGNGPVTPSTAW
jgi:hypothetical protein